VFLGSPIRHWWTKTDNEKTLHETDLYREYAEFRDNVREGLAKTFLVYSPHLAVKGPWNEYVGNAINNMALLHSDAFVGLCMQGVGAEGTARERAIARAANIPTFDCHFEWREQLDDWVTHITAAIVEERFKGLLP